ncbi:hypothetical protein AMTR_s00066p00046980 [Amborella trichopoda]|uniref:Uncharacterized protein n=1 Tax=Amborella trichopoda TaxID=13333 RepID=U5DF85_AMBTC|nr:hypothetical protein AMTR_s00066p00046980 [Amborella trichopoda]
MARESDPPMVGGVVMGRERDPLMVGGVVMGRERDPLMVGGVIGDVLDPFNRSVTLNVIYNSREVTNGCGIKPSTVVHPPREAMT